MPEEPEPYIGWQHAPRTDALGVVRKYLPAPRPDADRAPILNFTGPLGFGKSTMLRQLNKQYRQELETPVTYIDCEDFTGAGSEPLSGEAGRDRVPSLLLKIIVDLGQKWPGYGRIPFRRLELAFAVMKKKIDFKDQRHAYRELKSLQRKKSPWQEKLSNTGSSAVTGVAVAASPGIAPLRAPLDSAVSAAISYLLSRPLTRRRYQQWFGHRDRGIKRQADAGLAELSFLVHEEPSRRDRDQFLVDAFLADVRDAYGHGRLANPGWLSCLVLLDNADSPAGQELIEHLVDLRALYKSGNKPVPAEPVTIVATSREPIVAAAKYHDFPDLIEHHALPAFTELDVFLLSRSLPRTVDRRLPKLIHLATEYPAAVDAFIEAARQRPEVATGIDALLGAPSREREQDRTVEEMLYRDLVNALLGPAADASQQIRETYISCSAARDLTEANWLVQRHADSSLVGPGQLMESGLWLDDQRTAAHDLLRWLLLRRLAARDNAEPWWGPVYAELRDLNRSQGDFVGEMYYSLANGEVATVAERLTDRLTDQDADQPWDQVLRAVTSAPRQQLSASSEEPISQQLQLVESIEAPPGTALAPVARLVAGLWLAGSPITGLNRKSLHGQIAQDFGSIAAISRYSEALYKERERHKKLEQEWE